DVLELGAALLGGELVGDRPTRGARREPKLLLLGKLVDLDDRAVDLVVEIVTVLLPLPGEGEDLLEVGQNPDLGIDRQTGLPQEVERLRMATEPRSSLSRAELVGPEGQLAAGRDLRVLLAQRSRRRVARVGEHPPAGLALATIELLEGGQRHVQLAPHLQHRRAAAAVEIEA